MRSKTILKINVFAILTEIIRIIDNKCIIMTPSVTPRVTPRVTPSVTPNAATSSVTLVVTLYSMTGFMSL